MADFNEDVNVKGHLRVNFPAPHGWPTFITTRGISMAGPFSVEPIGSNTGTPVLSVISDYAAGDHAVVSVVHSGVGTGLFSQSNGNDGVQGRTESGDHSGVAGFSDSGGYGVYGYTNSPLSPGAAPGGLADLNIKAGVWGDNAGQGYGVRGTSHSIGVFGNGLTGTGVAGFGGNRGLVGLATGTDGIGVEGSGIQAGVKGEAAGPAPGRVGLLGRSVSSDHSDPNVNAALQAEAGALQVGGRGVLGIGQAVGVQGFTPTGHGVDGFSITGVGVSGGTSGTGPDSVGVFGVSQQGGASLAGKFHGNVDVAGNLSKSGGGFKIDHPLEPTEKHLNHSFVESPERKNVYDGTAVLDESGNAVVQLPAWFEAINTDFRYQLTCIGEFAPIHIARKLLKNRFIIAGGRAGMEVCWQVTGIRSDKWALANPLHVEEAKHESEQGRYRHKELYEDRDSVDLSELLDEPVPV